VTLSSACSNSDEQTSVYAFGCQGLDMRLAIFARVVDDEREFAVETEIVSRQSHHLAASHASH
jgi:hypothetical protein